jgi:carbon monoxide dehydrogenase subunit G
MKLSATFHIPAAREKVFRSITDPAVMQRCLEGCEEMVQQGNGVYQARLKLGSAAMGGSYTGKITIKDQKPPESYTLVVEGGGVSGFVKATSDVRLTEKDGQTDLHCESEAQVGGMIAVFGSRLVEEATRKMMNEFFRKFADLMREEG